MERMEKQTAVEWFFEQLTEVDYNCINKTFLQNDKSLAGYKMRELFEQAKEMDKERMLDFGDFIIDELAPMAQNREWVEEKYNYFILEEDD